MVAKNDDAKKVEVKIDTKKSEKKSSAKKTSAKPVENNVDVEVVKKTSASKKSTKADKNLVNDLADIKSAVDNSPANDISAPSADEQKVYVVKKDSLGRSYATGKRKDAVARVWIKLGKGDIVINGKKMTDYFKRPVLQMIVNQPFSVAKREDSFDVFATVSGGGLSGQAGAVKHGISKALCCFEPELRAPLKKAGFLTRDARTVERKKFGRAKARRSFQFSKR